MSVAASHAMCHVMTPAMSERCLHPWLQEEGKAEGDLPVLQQDQPCK